MKVFVGFGYNDNDKWIQELIIPFIETLGCEVLTGEEMQGENLAAGVIARIKESDALIGFLTRRAGPDANGNYTTHSWVISELAVAVTEKKAVFEVRQKNVDPQRGMLGDRQWYEFDDRAALMLEIAKFITKEKSKLAYKQLMLLPQDFYDAVRKAGKFATCKYQFFHKGREYEEDEARLVRMSGGYAVHVYKIPDEDAMIRITVEMPDGTWSSEFVPISTIKVNLAKDN